MLVLSRCIGQGSRVDSLLLLLLLLLRMRVGRGLERRRKGQK